MRKRRHPMKLSNKLMLLVLLPGVLNGLHVKIFRMENPDLTIKLYRLNVKKFTTNDFMKSCK